MPTPSRNEIYEAVIRKMVTQALEEQEDLFEQAHGDNTDEELILYLNNCAEELGYSPRYKEVIGWRLLEQRFGGWNETLQRADLLPAARCPVTKLPRIIEETEKQKERYRRKKAEKKLKNKQRMEAQARKKKKTRKHRPVFFPFHRPLVKSCRRNALDSFSASVPSITRWAALRQQMRQPSCLDGADKPGLFCGGCAIKRKPNTNS